MSCVASFLAILAAGALFTKMAVGDALAQAAPEGFAGLGRDAEGFRTVTPGRAFSFPADHAAHDGYRIEWWYLTANLEAADGERLGMQWTLFRTGLAPDDDEEQRTGWTAPYVWMAHAAVTTADAHLFDERFARGATGQAGVALGPFRAHIDNWRFEAADDALTHAVVEAQADEFAFRLTLAADRPIVLQGVDGYSVKTYEGHASYYFSQPFFTVDGEVTVNGETRAVTGQAWMDREWSSQALGGRHEGWDWFSLHLDNGEKVALAQVRDQSGPNYRAGAWIAADGTTTPLADGAVRLTPVGRAATVARNGRRKVRAPVRWRLTVANPARGAPDLEVETEPLNPKSWMATSFPYWEGPIRFSGSHQGVGYLEMTGYQ